MRTPYVHVNTLNKVVGQCAKPCARGSTQPQCTRVSMKKLGVLGVPNIYRDPDIYICIHVYICI